MSSSRIVKQKGAQTSVSLDLEWLEQLARDDPEGFEAERARLIERCIASTPAEDHGFLRRIQFRADAARRRAKTKLQANLQLSRLMWSSFHDMHQALNGVTIKPSSGSAKVLALPRPPLRRS
jgi:hypothetical protein